MVEYKEKLNNKKSTYYKIYKNGEIKRITKEEFVKRTRNIIHRGGIKQLPTFEYLTSQIIQNHRNEFVLFLEALTTYEHDNSNDDTSNDDTSYIKEVIYKFDGSIAFKNLLKQCLRYNNIFYKWLYESFSKGY